MVVVKRQIDLVRRVLATLLILSFVLTSFHVHGTGGSAESAGLVVAMLDVPLSHSDQTPDHRLPGDGSSPCTACALMKAFELPASPASVPAPQALRVVHWLYSEGAVRTLGVADLFRPPIVLVT